MLLVISFFVDMSFESYIKVTKTLQNLTHVTGVIKNERYIKIFHYVNRFQRSYYEDVLVFSIEGCTDEFGFLINNNNYEDLTKVRFAGDNKIMDIFYDKSGKKIKDNITLHTFDLKIDNISYIKIEDIQKPYKIAFLIFSLASVILLAITFLGIKSMTSKNN